VRRVAAYSPQSARPATAGTSPPPTPRPKKVQPGKVEKTEWNNGLHLKINFFGGQDFVGRIFLFKKC
jgi:hypothetical protein